jgi:hypothetical protein
VVLDILEACSRVVAGRDSEVVPANLSTTEEEALKEGCSTVSGGWPYSRESASCSLYQSSKDTHRVTLRVALVIIEEDEGDATAAEPTGALAMLLSTSATSEMACAVLAGEYCCCRLLAVERMDSHTDSAEVAAAADSSDGTRVTTARLFAHVDTVFTSASWMATTDVNDDSNISLDFCLANISSCVTSH